MPPAVLAQRVLRLRREMAGEGVDVLLAWTNFAQPAVVHWLTHFTPYWSEAVLVVPARGPTALLAALTPRVHEWIRSMCRVDRVVAAPRLGEALVRWLDENLHAQANRIGVVGLDAAPGSVLQPLVQARGAQALVDAAGLYRRVRQPADRHEFGLMLQARTLAEAAWAAVNPGLRTTAEFAARTESAARLGGAEEVLLRIAPDLGLGAIGVRPEPVQALGERYAAELSVAYKGAWVRVGRSVVRDGGAAGKGWAAAQAWFDSLTQGTWTGVADPPAAPPGLELQHWQLEASVDAWPMACVAHGPAGAATGRTSRVLPPGSLAVLSARLATPDGAWSCATPVAMTAGGLRTLASP